MGTPKTQIGLQHLTGAFKLTATTNEQTLGAVIGAGQDRLVPNAAYSLPSAISLDAISLGNNTDSLTGILQQFGDSIGKLTGRSNWTKASPGHIHFGDKTAGGGQNAFDIKIQQSNVGNQINLHSSGNILIESPINNAKVQGWKLLLSSSDSVARATEIFSSKGSTQIHASGSSSKLKLIAAAQSETAVLLSASSDNGSMAFVAGVGPGTAFRWHLGGFYSDADPGKNVKDPGRTLHLGEDKGKLTLITSGGRTEAQSDFMLSAGTAKSLYLSSSGGTAGQLFFAVGDGGDSNQMTTAGGGYVALASGQAELTTFISNNSNNTSLIGAINNAQAVTAAKGYYYKELTDLINSGSTCTLADGGPGVALQSNHNPGDVQVALNGQLLVSSSDDTTANPTTKDYVISGGEGTTAPVLRFAFQLEVGDQVQMWDLK